MCVCVCVCELWKVRTWHDRPILWRFYGVYACGDRHRMLWMHSRHLLHYTRNIPCFQLVMDSDFKLEHPWGFPSFHAVVKALLWKCVPFLTSFMVLHCKYLMLTLMEDDGYPYTFTVSEIKAFLFVCYSWRSGLFRYQVWVCNRGIPLDPCHYTQCSNSLRAGRFGDRIPEGAIYFAPVQTVPGPHVASCTVGTWSLYRGYVNHPPHLGNHGLLQGEL